MKNILKLALTLLFALPATVWAFETATVAKVPSYWQPIFDMKPELLISIILLGFITVLIIITAILAISAIKHVYYPNVPGEEVVGVLESAWNSFDEKYISGKHLDENIEGGVREGHVYDGIQELDNFMPPWLQVTMISTVIFAAIYLMNIFVWGGIDYQKEEYETEMVQAEIDVTAYLAKAASSIDETSVKVVTDKAAIEEGAKLFAANCKTCHGATAEGAAGPNLTDKDWLHGGTINDIFKTVKYGVKEKGMPTWQEKLRPIEIQHVANYILTLKK